MSDLLRAGTYKTAGLTDTGSFQQISGKSSIAEVRRADGLAVDGRSFSSVPGAKDNRFWAANRLVISTSSSGV